MARSLGNLLDLALEVCKAQTARLDAALKRLLEHPDKEAVHDVRVACRRLRVALKIANPFLRKKAAVTIRGRLKDLLERLGQARDTEVLAARAWKLLSAEHAVDGQSLPRPAGRDGPLRLLRLLQEHSDAQRRDAVEAIRRMGLTSVPRMIEALTAGPLASSERARRLLATPLARHARQVLSQRTGSLSRSAALHGQSRADELHALRIEMKKTRYAAEFFAAAFTPAAEPTASAGHRGPEPADPLAVSLNTIVKVAKSYQESLGELHDAVVAQAVLAGWLSAGVPSLAPEERNDAALRAALSDLVAAARADEATLRAAFARRWGPRDRMRLVL